MNISSNRFEWLRFFLALFIVSVAVNYVWETAQALLFVGMVSIKTIWWHCFVASLGDGIILWIIHLIGWATYGQWNWFLRTDYGRIALMLGAGLAMAIPIEWLAVHRLHRWAYTDHMPLIPVLDIGLTPILQMLILPPLIFLLTHKFLSLHEEDSP